MEAIQKGGSQKREPIYAQKAFSRNKNDIGTTYIEIDLTNQKMYYYEKGVQRISTDIVSGNMIRGNATPEGTFMVIQKARNRTLRGVGYESFVNYWIRVDGGIGIHDASWRSKYGGTIYKTKGSHGCINTPYVKVRELYSLVKMYTPIVCFY